MSLEEGGWLWKGMLPAMANILGKKAKGKEVLSMIIRLSIAHCKYSEILRYAGYSAVSKHVP